MNADQAMVREFHLSFEHPVEDRPRMLTPDRVESRARWMIEEVEEFRSAGNVVEQADAMIDLLYFAYGTLVEMGVDAEPLFEIVHRANMTKLWPDGKPRVRGDGKIIKPPTWVDPRPALVAEIERQMRASSSPPAGALTEERA